MASPVVSSEFEERLRQKLDAHYGTAPTSRTVAAICERGGGDVIATATEFKRVRFDPFEHVDVTGKSAKREWCKLVIAHARNVFCGRTPTLEEMATLKAREYFVCFELEDWHVRAAPPLVCVQGKAIRRHFDAATRHDIFQFDFECPFCVDLYSDDADREFYFLRQRPYMHYHGGTPNRGCHGTRVPHCCYIPHSFEFLLFATENTRIDPRRKEPFFPPSK